MSNQRKDRWDNREHLKKDSNRHGNLDAAHPSVKRIEQSFDDQLRETLPTQKESTPVQFERSDKMHDQPSLYNDGSDECGYCNRKRHRTGDITWCKRHMPRMTIKTVEYYSQEQLNAAIQAAVREARIELLERLQIAKISTDRGLMVPNTVLEAELNKAKETK